MLAGPAISDRIARKADGGRWSRPIREIPEHIIKIVCPGRKGHPKGKDPFINLDAFQWKGAFF